MEQSQLEKLTFKFEGKSNPTTDELIEVLQSVKEIIPKESRDTFHINRIEEGSIDIIAFVEPIIDFFTNTDIDVYWDVLDKILNVAACVGPTASWVYSKLSKAKINMSELNDLLEILNNDPNSIRIITHNDFKNFRKISKVLQKRKAKVVINRESRNQIVVLKEEDTKILDLIANASGDDIETSVENRLLHLEIFRVSFRGKERWKAKILEYNDMNPRFITIEDQNLLLSINRNQIYFSGKEVIEAMVRIETINGISKYYLTDYRNIVNIDEVEYQV